MKLALKCVYNIFDKTYATYNNRQNETGGRNQLIIRLTSRLTPIDVYNNIDAHSLLTMDFY